MIYTSDDILAEVRREIKMREHVYKAAVDDDRMSPELAKRRIEIMRQIEQDYEKKAEGERLI